MPDWREVLAEIKNEQLAAEQDFQAAQLKAAQSFDTIRRKYLQALFQHTGRNVIAYYSGWQSRNVAGIEIRDEDKNGFMMAVHGMDCDKGLDLVLHTPGGSISATHSIVTYLKEKFGRNIRAIVPHMAMSGGTIMALSGKEIVMARHSSIGPIDPQIGGRPAAGVLEEFERAYKEIKADRTSNKAKEKVWRPILEKYSPTYLGSCKNAVDWSEDFARELLAGNMLHKARDKEAKINTVIKALSDYHQVKTHERQINYTEARKIGLKIALLEDDPTLQDLVLTVHHCFAHTLSNTTSFKLIENHNGAAFVKMITQQQIPVPA